MRNQVATWKVIHLVLFLVLFLGGCGRQEATPPPGPKKSVSLTEARKGFMTKIVRKEKPGAPVPQPPPELYRLVRYDSPPGKLAAPLHPHPKDGKKHPAMIWMTGGEWYTIRDGVWKTLPAAVDQTARAANAFRNAGLVLMFPTLRGGNDNPGVKEGWFGEIDDVLAATDFLSKQPFVDPQRIYLAGHSTGGTLV